jgi:hypothetical protein
MKNTDSTINEYNNYCYREKIAGRIPKSKESYDQERAKGEFRSDGTYIGKEWNIRLGYPRILKPYIKSNGELSLKKLDDYKIKLSKNLSDDLPRWKRYKLKRKLEIINNFLSKELKVA